MLYGKIKVKSDYHFNSETGIKMSINKIKYIAIISMVCDHLASVFFAPDASIYIVLRLIGRITAPSMCLALAEGFVHTSNRKKYFSRLLTFAVIAQIPFSFFESGTFTLPIGNVLFTFACSFALMEVVENWKKIGKLKGIIAVIVLLVLSMKTDWLIFGPLFTLSIYMNKENKDRQAICYAAISVLSFSLSAFMCVSHGLPWYGQVWQIGTLLVIPIIYAYNGERGSKASFNKWFFYIFYPAHLVVLGLLR